MLAKRALTFWKSAKASRGKMSVDCVNEDYIKWPVWERIDNGSSYPPCLGTVPP